MKRYLVFALSLLLLSDCYGQSNSKTSGDSEDQTEPKEIVDKRSHSSGKSANNDGRDSVEYETIQHVKGMCFNNGKSEYYIYFLVGGQFITPDFSINTRLKSISDTEFNVYFYQLPVESTESRVEDRFKSYSENVPIARADHRDGKLRLTWYGFYDTKTKKRVYTENPFDRSKKTVVLKHCKE